MAITRTGLTSGGTELDASSFTTASITPTANTVVVIYIANRRADSGNPPTTPTVSGCNLTWTQAGTANDAGARRITAIWGTGASPTTGTLTIDFAGVSQERCLWSVNEFPNADTISPIVQTASATGAAVTTFSVTLAAFASASNATVGGFARNTNSAFTVGTGFSLMHTEAGGGANSIDTEWRNDNDTSVDATVATSSNYTGLAFELRALSDATVSAAIALATAAGYVSTPTIQVPAVLATATADGYAATPTLQVPGALATATAGGYISTPTVQVPAAIATATAGGYVGEIQIVIPAALATATAGGYAASLITDVILAAAQALATAGGYTAEIQVIVPAAQALATAGGYTATPTIEVPAALATATAGGYAASLTIQVLAALATATAEALVAVPGVSVVAVVATATAGGLVITIAISPKAIYSTGLYVDTVYKTGLHADTIYKRGLHVDTVYLTGTFP